LFSILLTLLILLIIWFAVAHYLSGADLGALDAPAKAAEARRQSFSTGDSLNAEHRQVIKLLADLASEMKQIPLKQHLGHMRRFMDSLSAGHELTA